ncbi:hypothetical protein IE90_04470 [Sanguibacteroides justesenii]|uniref:Uncharacterized protein n=1 Tax=Sanguibacteroides justesenii TaxID=1547597 RepID=A0AB34R4V3_9PORP|nr:hypothetical protein IE90_04470 [Sanguibacteroides justesenii]
MFFGILKSGKKKRNRIVIPLFCKILKRIRKIIPDFFVSRPLVFPDIMICTFDVMMPKVVHQIFKCHARIK